MTAENQKSDHPTLSMRRTLTKKCLSRFDCGVREINKWASDKAFKMHDRGRARVALAFADGSNTACGFYSLSMTMEAGQKLLRQEDRDAWQDRAPLVYIDWLAVTRVRQRGGIGGLLLVDALKQAADVNQIVPIYGVGLRSLNEDTERLYGKFGFTRAPLETDRSPLMILPIWTIQDLFKT